MSFNSTEKFMKCYQVVVIGLISVFFIACNQPKSIADGIMDDLRTGEFKYLTGANGDPILYDSKNRLTHRLIEHLMATQGKLYNYSLDLDQLVFQLPSGVMSYELIKDEESTAELAKVENTSESNYNKATYLHNSYKTYKSYRDQQIKWGKEKAKFEILTNDRIRFYEKYFERRFHYRVQTLNSILSLQVVLIKEDEVWKVAAIMGEKI